MAATEKIDKEIDRLFSDELMPLAAKLKANKQSFLDTQLDATAESYFVKRPEITMTKSDFEFGGCASPDSVEKDLANLWKRRNMSAFGVLCPGIARLAKTLRQTEVESDSVSNFVYVMY